MIEVSVLVGNLRYEKERQKRRKTAVKARERNKRENGIERGRKGMSGLRRRMGNEDMKGEEEKGKR